MAVFRFDLDLKVKVISVLNETEHFTPDLFKIVHTIMEMSPYFAIQLQ